MEAVALERLRKLKFNLIAVNLQRNRPADRFALAPFFIHSFFPFHSDSFLVCLRLLLVILLCLDS